MKIFVLTCSKRKKIFLNLWNKENNIPITIVNKVNFNKISSSYLSKITKYFNNFIPKYLIMKILNNLLLLKYIATLEDDFYIVLEDNSIFKFEMLLNYTLNKNKITFLHENIYIIRPMQAKLIYNNASRYGINYKTLNFNFNFNIDNYNIGYSLDDLKVENNKFFLKNTTITNKIHLPLFRFVNYEFSPYYLILLMFSFLLLYSNNYIISSICYFFIGLLFWDDFDVFYKGWIY